MKKKEDDIRRKIAREVRKAINGSGKVKVTFKEDAVDALDQFCKLERKGAIMMSDSCAAILSAAKRRKYWGHASNRITTIFLGVNFNEKEFVRCLARAIEDVQAIEKVK